MQKVILIGCILFLYGTTFSQKADMQLDSALNANSEKWKVKANRKMFGLASPSFGPYKTIQSEKLDSPVIRRRIKGDGTLSYESHIGFDHTREVTYHVEKSYHLLLANEKDTSETIYSVLSDRTEQKQTFLGSLISKKDEDDKVLAADLNIKGIIIGTNSIPGNFYYHRRSGTGSGNGYLKTANDSIWMEPAKASLHNLLPKYRNKYFIINGIQLINMKGETLACFQFSQPENVWIRKDIDPALQNTIAIMFAVMSAF